MMIDSDRFMEVVKILKDENLVWSDDFDAIRDPLRKLLLSVITLGSSGAANLPLQMGIVQKQVDELLKAIVKD